MRYDFSVTQAALELSMYPKLSTIHNSPPTSACQFLGGQMWDTCLAWMAFKMGDKSILYIIAEWVFSHMTVHLNFCLSVCVFVFVCVYMKPYQTLK